MRTRVAGLFVVWLGCVLLSSSVWGQTTLGSSVGTVTDATDAVAANVLVTLVSLGTNEKRVSTTSADGLYSFVNLVPGTYRIEVEKSGF